MNIRAQDVVLEIGSGHNPKTRADVLCDKYLLDDTERGGHLVADRPLVIADAEALPFPDGAFDYVICSHVLEHARNVRRFISEVERVGRAGYIETPSEVGEWLYGWEYHRWLVNRIGDRLVLRRKRGSSPFGKLFHRMNATDARFRRLHERYHHLFLVQYEWRGRIAYEIRKPSDAPLDLEQEAIVDALLASPSSGPAVRRVVRWVWGHVPDAWRAPIKAALSRDRAVRRPRVDLRKLLVCPRCHGALDWREDAILCARDDLTFGIRDGIPMMLLPQRDGAKRDESSQSGGAFSAE